eukprot:1706976-Prymnesium_polylepis.1
MWNISGGPYVHWCRRSDRVGSRGPVREARLEPSRHLTLIQLSVTIRYLVLGALRVRYVTSRPQTRLA